MSDRQNNRVLEIRGLTKIFGIGCPDCERLTGPETGISQCPRCSSIVACSDVHLTLDRGEILGIVGESGSGKSTLVRCLYFDEAATKGEAYMTDCKEGTLNIFDASSQKKRHIRNHLMGMVYQNPLMGIKPHFTAGGNVAEKLLTAEIYNYGVIRSRAADLLNRTEVPLARMDDFPARFSGGMQQRVQIAKALANNPPLLFLDEVTTGLDVSVQARVLDLIKEIQQELKVAMIAVSHDMGVIRMLADRTCVMKNGRVVEMGLTDQIMEDPQHFYTQLLVHSMV
ncbi:MAG: ATP-binding cassette domain-containing protein [Negativicutes bacterium]